MKSLLVFVIALMTITFSYSQNVNLSSGSIVRIENFPSKLVVPRNVDIWLPAGFSPEKKYAVLYMHDGASLFDSTTTWNHQEWKVDEVISSLIQAGKIKECIVVGIYNLNAKRHAEFFPQKPFEMLSDENKKFTLNYEDIYNNRKLLSSSPTSDNYLKFLVTELKPYIDSVYSTLPGVKNTFIAGSSMGGLISWYAICEYPDVFGGAACISTHWPGVRGQNDFIPAAFLTYLKDHLPSPETHKIYFDYGSLGLDSTYKPYQLKVDSLMKAKNYNEENWVTKEFLGEDHSESSWQKRLHIPVEFLLKK